MPKLTDIDKLLEQLENSVMLKKLIQTIKRYWDGESEQIVKSSQKVDYTNREIVAQKEIIEKIIEVPVEKIIEKNFEITPTWALHLEEQKEYLDSLTQFPELQSFFNIQKYDDATNILAFISFSSQWHNIVRIWEKFAEQCKGSQQVIELDKLKLLENAINLYNLTLSDAKVELRLPNLQTGYDYKIHNQVAGSGNQIKVVLLPGLYNASGEKVKSALVITG
ncbi:hypothetical protein E0H86_11800 [Acinetobacter sp. ANC 4635]|uniref:hypothetical protein n=1 Tax=Acinetobacter sp. ANC 4635 TaxID=2529846 RepID=UPI001039F116|nr:hypothetical protein [Acinetobacter sp. ANC 4635]TCB28483.1 hypothetical protein E0H86_11800 [Acinetobacter sp. ANC 4635]